MNIEKYISDLLYRYQCVTIPGFGAFLTDFKSAQIDNINSIISPPKKTLSFNYHLQNNDGLLANHISVEEKISYSEAVVAIKNKVDYWLLKLEFGERITLENIGELVKNKEGNIEFYPVDSVNYDTDSFGMANIVAPDVSRETYKAEQAVTNETLLNDRFEKNSANEKSAVDKLFESKETTAAPVTPKKKVVPTANKETKKSKSGSYIAVAAALVLLFGGGYAYKLYNDDLVEKVTLAVQKDVQDKVEQKIQEATFVMSNPIEAVEVKVTNSTSAPIEETTTTAATQVSDNVPYHIIAGSFKSEENAKKKTKELQNSGYSDAQIVGKNAYQLYMVAYKSFTEYDHAINELKNIQQDDNQEAWLYTKR